MLRLSVRRLFVGLVVAGLLATATPAQASGFRLESGLRIQDLWSHAWSWLADLFVTESRSADAAASNYTKDAPPGPPPGPPPPGQRGRPNGTNSGGGDTGGGVDPDG